MSLSRQHTLEIARLVTDGLTESVTAEGGGFWGEDAFWLIQNGVVALGVVVVLASAVLRFTTFGRSVFASESVIEIVTQGSPRRERR